MRPTIILAIIQLLVLTCPAAAQTAGPPPTDAATGVYYVAASALNVRFAPAGGGQVATRLDRGEKVYVFETRDGWARISKPFSGESVGLPGIVAYWVSLRYLSREAPG